MPWVYDSTHSVIAFDNKHLGIAVIKGWFKEAEVTVQIDDADLTHSSVHAVIQAASIDTGVERRDDTLRDDIYLDVAKYPTIEFRSTHIEPRGDRYDLIGDFTLHGTTRPVTLDAQFNGSALDQRDVTRRGFSAATTIRRSDFGVGTTMVNGIPMAAEDIHLSFEIELALRE